MPSSKTTTQFPAICTGTALCQISNLLLSMTTFKLGKEWQQVQLEGRERMMSIEAAHSLFLMHSNEFAKYASTA